MVFDDGGTAGALEEEMSTAVEAEDTAEMFADICRCDVL